MKKDLDPSFWPDYLREVFREVHKAMGGERLHPDVLQRIPTKPYSVLADHTVRVEHRSGGLGRPKGNHYVITIDGPRFAGLWKFWSGELEQLARASAERRDD